MKANTKREQHLYQRYGGCNAINSPYAIARSEDSKAGYISSDPELYARLQVHRVRMANRESAIYA